MNGIKICFVAHNAYSAMTGDNTEHVGGIERQQATMAKWLAARGHTVSVVVWGRDGGGETEVDGVKIINLCSKGDGIPGLRFFIPRWTSLVRALRVANADIYYYNLGDLGLGQVVRWCKSSGKFSIYSVSSDSVCGRDLENVLSLRERLLYRYGVRNVDKIVVQTGVQERLLRENFNRASQALPMPCKDLGEDSPQARAPIGSAAPRVLWVGRLSAEKRPNWVLDVAEICPDLKFDVVGHANRKTEFSRAFISRAEGLDNVTLHGAVDHHQIAAYFSDANALLCTSAFEGFPNVFLEAWSLGLPVVSTFDPDGIIGARGLGLIRDNVAGIAEALIALLGSPKVWQDASTKARDYFQQNHTIDEAMSQFVAVFRRLLDQEATTHSSLDRTVSSHE